MAIASRFQPQNLAQQRFNPFYGEMPKVPWGPGIQRRTSRIQNGIPGLVNQTQGQDVDLDFPDWFFEPPDPNAEYYQDYFQGPMF